LDKPKHEIKIEKLLRTSKVDIADLYTS